MLVPTRPWQPKGTFRGRGPLLALRARQTDTNFIGSKRSQTKMMGQSFQMKFGTSSQFFSPYNFDMIQPDHSQRFPKGFLKRCRFVDAVSREVHVTCLKVGLGDFGEERRKRLPRM